MSSAVANLEVRERRRAALMTLAMLLPLMLIFVFIYWPGLAAHGNAEPAQPHVVNPPLPTQEATADGRLIVVIIDSLRQQAVEELMPNLKAFAQQPGAVYLSEHTAAANMSLSCIQTLLEGRESPYVSGIHYYANVQSANDSLPAAAAAAGLHPALVGDFVINELYGRHAAVAVDIASLPGGETIANDTALIEKAISILDSKIGVLILHVPGTDYVAHEYHPGHPEYARHYREVDAKLAEFFAHLDLKKDHVIVTGDHGHDDRGNHVPESVAIFAGGVYPELFSALGPLGELQQIDMLFFMAFALNLPLPVAYEGRYFGVDTPINLTNSAPEFVEHFQRFVALQKSVLSAAGFGGPNFKSAIAAKRARMNSASAINCERTLPLAILYLGWVAVGYYLNDSGTKQSWLLAVMLFPAVALWLFASPATGIFFATLIALAAFAWAIKARQLRRVCFLFLLIGAAAFTACEAENWEKIFRHHELIILLPAGALLLLVRGGGILEWPTAIGSLCLFALPSGPYRVESGLYILRGFFIGLAVMSILLVARGRFLQLKFRSRQWIALVGLLATIALLMCQTANIGIVFNRVANWLKASPATLPLSVAIYVLCGAYIVWIVQRTTARVAIAALLLILPIYCVLFAQLSFVLLALEIAVPVFLASWLVVTDAAPLRDQSDAAHERAGLFLFAALVMAFWMVLQGFFIHEIDFSFALKYAGENASEGREILFAYPLTLLKYGLPLALILAVCVAFRGVLSSRQMIIAALLFCNVKLAALILQAVVGPLRSHQKLYEFAMSDVVFISQIELILGLSYLAILYGAPLFHRLRHIRA